MLNQLKALRMPVHQKIWWYLFGGISRNRVFSFYWITQRSIRKCTVIRWTNWMIHLNRKGVVFHRDNVRPKRNINNLGRFMYTRKLKTQFLFPRKSRWKSVHWTLIWELIRGEGILWVSYKTPKAKVCYRHVRITI